MKPLPDKYEHGEAESRWQNSWEKADVYRWDSSLPREQTYVIDTPPPTVSGTLHMGHVFSYTQADFIARYQRMSGKTVFYPMGFDDNGLPTERLVEKTKKVRATDMTREEFIELCMGVSEEARKEFRDLFTSIALSIDWNEEYHTVSEQSRRISQMSFLDRSLWGSLTGKLFGQVWFYVDEMLFVLGWAAALLAAGVWGARNGRRFMVNTVVVFASIHFYTQWFEHLGGSPVTVMLAGLLTVGIGLGLWRYNQRVLEGGAA